MYKPTLAEALTRRELQVLKGSLKHTIKDVESKLVKYGDYSKLEGHNLESYDTLNNTRRTAIKLLKELM